MRTLRWQRERKADFDGSCIFWMGIGAVWEMKTNLENNIWSKCKALEKENWKNFAAFSKVYSTKLFDFK